MTIDLDEGVLPRAGSAPSLYFRTATPSNGTKAVVGIVHGYADHGARYAHVTGALAEYGIASVAIDLRGHGRADGPRGYCTRFVEFLEDARELRRLVAARFSGVPAFLLGHSFGGLVAATSVIEDPISCKGLVLSAPFFGLALEVPPVKVVAGKIASRVYPKLGLPSGLSGKDLTHDAKMASDYDADPLVFKNATARWFTETARAQRRALEEAERLRMSLYVTFGTADKVASYAAARRWFDATSSADKTWDPREGLFHEVLNELCWKDIVEKIAAWILARTN